MSADLMALIPTPTLRLLVESVWRLGPSLGWRYWMVVRYTYRNPEIGLAAWAQATQNVGRQIIRDIDFTDPRASERAWLGIDLIENGVKIRQALRAHSLD